MAKRPRHLRLIRSSESSVQLKLGILLTAANHKLLASNKFNWQWTNKAELNWPSKWRSSNYWTHRSFSYGLNQRLANLSLWYDADFTKPNWCLTFNSSRWGRAAKYSTGISMPQIPFLLSRTSLLNVSFIFDVSVAVTASSVPAIWFWSEGLRWRNGDSDSGGRKRGGRVPPWCPWFSCKAIALLYSLKLLDSNLNFESVNNARWGKEDVISEWNWLDNQLTLNWPIRGVRSRHKLILMSRVTGLIGPRKSPPFWSCRHTVRSIVEDEPYFFCFKSGPFLTVCVASRDNEANWRIPAALTSCKWRFVFALTVQSINFPFPMIACFERLSFIFPFSPEIAWKWQQWFPPRQNFISFWLVAPF